eukprot:jgi/Bigna1/88058/estExt_fgenesh1_pg.C_270170
MPRSTRAASAASSNEASSSKLQPQERTESMEGKSSFKNLSSPDREESNLKSPKADIQLIEKEPRPSVNGLTLAFQKGDNEKWVDKISNCNVYSHFQNLVNAIIGFHGQFSKGKYIENFSKVSLPLSEILRLLDKERPPSDVMVATISGVIQTQFDELRKKKSGRSRLDDFSRGLVACQKCLTTFITELQAGIRKNSYFKDVSQKDKATMEEAFAVIDRLQTLHSKEQLQKWLLAQISKAQIAKEEKSRHDNHLRHSSLVHLESPAILAQKIDSLNVGNFGENVFSCTPEYFKTTFARTLARQPLIAIFGIALVTFSAGYVCQTGLANYSGYEYNGCSIICESNYVVQLLNMRFVTMEMDRAAGQSGQKEKKTYDKD